MIDPTTSERDYIVRVQSHRDDVASVGEFHDLADRRLLELSFAEATSDEWSSHGGSVVDRVSVIKTNVRPSSESRIDESTDDSSGGEGL